MYGWILIRQESISIFKETQEGENYKECVVQNEFHANEEFAIFKLLVSIPAQHSGHFRQITFMTAGLDE